MIAQRKRVLTQRNSNIKEEENKEITHVKKRYHHNNLQRTTTITHGGNNANPNEYLKDIIKYLHHIETKTILEPNFLNVEGCPDGRLRQILVDWLVHVQRKFGFHNETFQLAVFLLDRSLLKLCINKLKFELLGISCFFVAAKYEEYFTPNIEDFICVAEDKFVKEDVLIMEQEILKAVDFRCTIAYVVEFLRHFRLVLSMSRDVYKLAKYICEIGIVAYGLAHHLPSVIAAVSINLATYILESTISLDKLKKILNIKERELQKLTNEFIPYVLQFTNPNYKLYALREKHKSAPIPFTEVQIKRMEKLYRN